MAMLKALLPVLAMMGLGMFCRKIGLLTGKCVDDLKKFMTQVILPAAVFHALATARYSASLIGLVGLMVLFMAITFAVGFLLKPLMPPAFRRYIPYMVAMYEGGMMAYPLYASLCGSENLSQIALLDIAGVLFGYSVYLSLLNLMENGKAPTAKQILSDTLHTPTFIAAVLGILAGVTGAANALLKTPAGDVYTDVISMVTSPLAAMILVVVGYSIVPKKQLILPCLKTIGLRVVLQALATLGMLWAVHRFIGSSREMDLAILIYMSAPCTFSVQAFIKDDEASAYVSTTNALYCFLSVGIYAVAAALI